jgi:hypothetical protein
MNVEACTFPNIGWLETEVPESFRPAVLQAIEKPGEDYRRALAGHTSEAYLLPDLGGGGAFEMWLIDLAKQYDECFPAYANTICHHKGVMDLRLDDVWVNFSKQHDFNPMHWHGGVFSFVIWTAIPYKAEDELAQYQANNPAAGQFSFTVTDVLGEIHDHTVEQREWTTLFFPAKMRHKVTPFYTTDKTRVSLAGNLCLV